MKLKELKKIWKQLKDVPVNNDDEIETPFLHFGKGTDKHDIWHWFEEQHRGFFVGKMVNN